MSPIIASGPPGAERIIVHRFQEFSFVELGLELKLLGIGSAMDLFG
jgi:hypothetical protein